MTLDLSASDAVFSNLSVVLMVITSVGAVVLLLASSVNRANLRFQLGIIGGAIALLAGGPLWYSFHQDNKDRPSDEEVAIQQIESHYGLSVPEAVIREYLPKHKPEGDAARFEFEMVADNSLNTYAFKEQDGKLYLFQKTQDSFQTVTTTN